MTLTHALVIVLFLILFFSMAITIDAGRTRSSKPQALKPPFIRRRLE